MKLTTKPTETAVTLEVDGLILKTDRGQSWIFWVKFDDPIVLCGVHEFEGFGFFHVRAVTQSSKPGVLPVLRAYSIKPEAVRAEDVIGDHHD